MKIDAQKLMECLKSIESDAFKCRQEGEDLEKKGDKLNAYLMNTQAMAHELDLARIRLAMNFSK